MPGIGTLVNAVAILICGGLGAFVVPRMPDRFQTTVIRALGLGVMLIGLQMAWQTQEMLVVLVGLALGALVGEALQIESALQRLGQALETRLGDSQGQLARSFVQTTLIFCVGPMAITGAFADGLAGNPQILYAKAVLDGIVALMFSSAMGVGPMFAAIPVLIYQGGLTLGAGFLAQVLTEPLIREMSAVGGLMVMGIGFNQTEITQIKVGNLLPGLVLTPLLAALKELAVPLFGAG